MTTITKWSPLREIDAMERRMRRMFGDIGFAPALLPAADVYETDDEFVVELEVPGYSEQELKIEIADHRLRLAGERTEEEERAEKAYRLHERLEREFERVFDLPADADPEHVKATFSKGVLAVRVPKKEAAKPRTIEIEAA